MLKEKVVFVTGASGGIGAAVAQECARQGAFVFLGYHQNRQKAEEVQRGIIETGGSAALVLIDLANYELVNQAVREILSEAGHIDSLVNCAGIHQSGPLTSLRKDEIVQQIHIALTGAIFLTQAVVASMISRRQGSIVHMGSVSAHRMVRGHSIYSAAKAGLEGFTKALAAEVAKRSVRINCVIPGPVRTPMLEKSMNDTGDDPAQRVPMGRTIKAEEVAAFCAFLLSDKAAAITGGCFPIDGGYLLW